MKSSPIKLKQKLSKEAALKKAARDKKMAMSPARKRKKAQNQRLDRAEGTVGDGLDRHHTKSGAVKKVSVKNNRGFYGKGTKKEKR
jgi:hypothetical protein